MFICLRKHEISSFTAAVRRDLIFLRFEACLFTKVTRRSFCFPEPSFGFPTLIRMYVMTLPPAINGIYRPATISFSLYPAVLPLFIWWDKLTKLNRSFCPSLPITPLILKSFLNKLVWFKLSDPSCLVKGIYVIPVAAARAPVSVLPASYWYCFCWAVPLLYITSCGACYSCWLVRALFFCCSQELISCPTKVLWPSNLSAENSKSCKIVFRSSGSLSTSSMRS